MAVRMTQAPPQLHRRPGRKPLVAAALLIVLSILLILGLIWAVGGFRQTRGKVVTLIGSTSVEPFAELLAEKFQEIHPDLSVEVQGGGSTAGVQALKSGLSEIGMVSRSLSPKEAETLKPITIARDGLAVIVNNSNPIDVLTDDQVRQIYSGRIANWKELGGRDSRIHLIMREEGSGTREAFMHLVMHKQDTGLRAMVQESNGAVKELVRTDPAAIGYMSLGLVGTQVKALRINGIEATHENVMNASYTLVRPFLFAVRRQTDEPATRPASSMATRQWLSQAEGLSPQGRKFIQYVLSEEGQAVLESEGLVRVE